MEVEQRENQVGLVALEMGAVPAHTRLYGLYGQRLFITPTLPLDLDFACQSSLEHQILL